MAHKTDPLSASPPAEVPLPDAPLVRVIAQVRFSPILAIQNAEFIAPFQEEIRSEYPVLRQEQVHGVTLGPHEPSAAPKQTTWRFCATGSAWRVSLTSHFVALETTEYSSRSDLLNRLQVVVAALEKHMEPALVQRMGLRYIDRIEGDALASIDKLVRKEMLGIMATSMSNHVEHSLSETVLSLPSSGDRLRVRWGHLPANGTVDPGAIEPIDNPCWVLDLDMFSASEQPFSTDVLLADTRRYAERLYTVFRWAVTDEFLRRYGGEL